MADIRVAIADDSAVVRHVLTQAINGADGFELVGAGKDGDDALRVVAETQPDALILDVEMPQRNGLDVLSALRDQGSSLPVVMFSTLTERGAKVTVDALVRGANDYVTKPTGGMDAALQLINEELLPKVAALVDTRPKAASRARPTTPTPTARPSAATRPRPGGAGRADAAVIAVSTGGPKVLAEVVPLLPTHLRGPVFVVQHMPERFTQLLADRLDGQSDVHVVEASEGQPARPGTVYVAPGGRHLLLRRQGSEVVCALDDSPPRNGCRPSADPLFETAASIYREKLFAAVLTGMGRDGADGAAQVVAHGGLVVAQDESSSTVWGMPGAVVSAGHTDDVGPPSHIAETLVNKLGG